MKAFLAIAITLMLAQGAAFRVHVSTVCHGVRNVALCDLSLQAGDSDVVARALGNGEGR